VAERRGIPVIGIIGGIGAGKSSVSAILRELGCVVADSDALAREALHDPDVRRMIHQRLGSSVFDADGTVNRSALARLVFADTSARAALEAVVHPWIEARRRTIFAAAPAGTPALVLDAPLLIEAGLAKECDALIGIDVPRTIRLRRVAESRGWKDEELRKREEAQMPLDEKLRLADYTVRNDGDLSGLAEQIRSVLRKIVAQA